MTANASPAVLAPVDVDKVLAVLGWQITEARRRKSKSVTGSAALAADVKRLEEARAAVEQMAAELAAAREQVEACEHAMAEAWKARDEARQRAEAAEADAARWRFVRDNSNTVNPHIQAMWAECKTAYPSPQEWDAAIDAARGAKA